MAPRTTIASINQLVTRASFLASAQQHRNIAAENIAVLIIVNINYCYCLLCLENAKQKRR